MLAYLNEVLGLSAQEGPWPDAQRLPLYLRGGCAEAVRGGISQGGAGGAIMCLRYTLGGRCTKRPASA